MEATDRQEGPKVLRATRVALGVTAATAALAALGAVQGCGETDGDERGRVRAVYAELQDRFEARDAHGVCARISSTAKRQVGSLAHELPTTCTRDIRRLFKWIKPNGSRPGGSTKRSRPRLVSVAVDGETATATARLDDEATGRIPFVDEDGWKLDDFFGITAPPPPDMR
jgi:hypothetical protein